MEISAALSVLLLNDPLSSSKQHSEINDCLEDNREDY